MIDIDKLAELIGHRPSDEANRTRLERALHAVARSLELQPAAASKEILARHGDAFQRFVKAATVRETHFFRHAEHFEALLRCAKLTNAEGREWRWAWSVGCSTGEEAYSLALTLRQAGSQARVVGTDLCADSLRFAEAAVYGPNSFRERNPADVVGLEPRGSKWAVRSDVRSMVVFREQNLAEDPVLPPQPLPSTVDVIFCRNVMLYFRPKRAAIVARWLLEAVAPGGVIVFGALEGPSQVPEEFERVSDTEGCFFYRPLQPPKPRPRAVPTPPRAPARKPSAPTEAPRPWSEPPAGNFTNALAQARAQAAGNDPAAMYLAALQHAERGELGHAEACLLRLLLIRPDFVPALLHLALITHRAGDATGFQHYRERLDRLLRGRSDDETIDLESLTAGYVRGVLGAIANP